MNALRLSPQVHTDVLPSGLRVVTVAMPHLHTAALVVFVKVGSRFEEPAESGLSHFTEHMLFRGTERYPSSLAINLAIESLGGTLYAETGRDCSLYHVALAPDQIDAGMALLGEILCRPTFADIELERQLVVEEMAEDYDERGNEINADDIARHLAFGDHPLGQRIIGPPANVRGFAEADVRRHFSRFYCAANMLVCAAGPVDAAAVTASARLHLSAIPTGEPAFEQPAPTDQDAPRYRFVRDAGPQTSIHAVLRAIPDRDSDYAASLALLRAVDDGMSTPLHYRLCDQQGLAYSLSAAIEPLADCALFEVAGATSSAKVPALVSGILSLLAGFRDAPVSDETVTKIRRRYYFDLISALDDSFAMASWYGGTALYYPPPSLDERRAQMEAITAGDIQTAARRVFRPEALSMAVVGGLNRARQGEVRAAVTDWQ